MHKRIVLAMRLTSSYICDCEVRSKLARVSADTYVLFLQERSQNTAEYLLCFFFFLELMRVLIFTNFIGTNGTQH